MTRAQLLLGAFTIDWLLGDPETLPHPVRWMGKGIARGELALRRRGQSDLEEFLAGMFFTASIVLTSYTLTAAALRIATQLRLRAPIELLLASTCLASRNLADEASVITRLLRANDIPRARQRLGRIVGRDTWTLDERQICRAVIETVAESTCDGVIAPIFYMAIGGVPLAMAYKAVNTLDSMIGHADARYLYFGKSAARLDDLANYLPARLSALAVVTSAALGAGDPKASLATWQRDHSNTRSPNAGHPESAMAGALRVSLGGRNTYGGESIESQPIGFEHPPATVLKAERAIVIMSIASILGIATACLLQPHRRARVNL